MNENLIQPLGRMLSHAGRTYLHLLNSRLDYLDIERYYYALLLIGEGENKLTQNKLAAQLETDKVSVVRIIDYLSDKGYVEREKSSSDRRKYCLTLTAKGSKAIPGIKKSIEELNNKALEGLSASEKTTFYNSLLTIKTNLLKANNAEI
jgi:MarR family transcriptional regulator, transcriptional regulator for hemolysin